MLVKATQFLSLLKIMFVFNLLLLGCSEKKEKQKVEKKKTKTALTIIKNDDCLNCHSIEDKSVGPSYVKVAQRYESDYSTVNRLAKKIIEGGGGLWGGGQMSKHPLLKSNDARRVVRWILSLDDSVANPDPMVITPAVSLREALEANLAESENGLALYVYSQETPSENSAAATPQHTGVVESVHFTGEGAFDPLPEGCILKMTGFITIQQSGKYFFKQVRTGKGKVILDGATIINENDWDRETDID
ncbi:MAG: PA14 domain-containing protein, partial [Bacteroidota bacterium]